MSLLPHCANKEGRLRYDRQKTASRVWNQTEIIFSLTKLQLKAGPCALGKLPASELQTPQSPNACCLILHQNLYFHLLPKEVNVCPDRTLSELSFCNTPLSTLIPSKLSYYH